MVAIFGAGILEARRFHHIFGSETSGRIPLSIVEMKQELRIGGAIHVIYKRLDWEIRNPNKIPTPRNA